MWLIAPLEMTYASMISNNIHQFFLAATSYKPISEGRGGRKVFNLSEDSNILPLEVIINVIL